MKAILFVITVAFSFSVYAQNLLTQNPSFEDVTDGVPDGWTADGSVMEIVTDATDGSNGLKLTKAADNGTRCYRIVTTQFITLEGELLSLKFDYKVAAGMVQDVGFIMLPETYEFAANIDIQEDGEWHLNNFADMVTTYVGAGWATDYLNVQVCFGTMTEAEEAELLIDNLAFGYKGTLMGTTDLISQDITLGPNPTKSTITFFNVDKITNKTVKVFDLSGKLVLQTELVGEVLDLSRLKAGVYMLQLGDSFTKKIVKK